MIWYFLIPQRFFFLLLTFQVISENQRKTQNWLFLSSAISADTAFFLGAAVFHHGRIFKFNASVFFKFNMEGTFR